MLSASVIRPVASRVNHGSGGAVSERLVQVVLGVCAACVFFPAFWRTIVKKELGRPFAPDLRRFAIVAAPLMLAVFVFIDLFVGWPFWEQPAVWPLQLQVGGSCALVLLGYHVLVGIGAIRLE